MLSRKHLSYSSLFLLAIVLSIWSAFIIFFKKIGPLNDLGKPDAFMEDVVATFIDKEGNPTLKLSAVKMTHYLQNDATEISKPILTFYRKSPTPWYLTADHARSSQGINQILLWENVIIHQPSNQENEETTLLTPSLTVYPNQQTATTAAPVIINQPNTTIHAIGMNADLASGVINLLSQAKGEFSVQE